MLILFRVDASIDIGAGHVMRCLSLANALKKTGNECRFICANQKGNLIELIQANGYFVHQLTEVRRNGDFGFSKTSGLPKLDEKFDALQALTAIGHTKADWLVVDHYQLGGEWESLMRSVSRHMMVIDDLADRSHDCDVLLDQTFGRESSDYDKLTPLHCEALCGSQYALLRPEFAEARAMSLARRQTAEMKRILIAMGGVDKDNMTALILKSVQAAKLPHDCKITVLMGTAAPWIDDVVSVAASSHLETEVMVGIADVAAVMSQCDLAIGAPGTSSWERCCLGLPSILVVIASNQTKVAAELNAVGAACMIDRKKIELSLVSQINRFVSEPKALADMSQNASRLVDGLGVQRVIEGMGHIGEH